MSGQVLLSPVSASAEFRRIPQLDGVRGIAILQVLIWHYSAGVRAEQKTLLAYIIRSFYLTWSGVDLFFVLSGFLIGGMLLDNRESLNYFRVFYVRRFFRIVPIYPLLWKESYGLVQECMIGDLPDFLLRSRRSATP